MNIFSCLDSLGDLLFDEYDMGFEYDCLGPSEEELVYLSGLSDED